MGRSGGKAYVSVDFYNDRMYPYGCKGETTAVLSLSDSSGRTLTTKKVRSMNGFGYLQLDELKAGSAYNIRVSSIRWGRHAVKDFTVSVYAGSSVTIQDAQGNEGNVQKWRHLEDKRNP